MTTESAPYPTAGPEAVFTNPQHPYTRALIDAAPVTHPARRRTRDLLTGEPPSPMAAGTGCAFRSRCPHAIGACHHGVPPLRGVTAGHLTACIRGDLPTLT